MKKDMDLFYTCSLIEFIGRRQKQRRSFVVSSLGFVNVKQIYSYADVFHCEPITNTADEFISSCNIGEGSFDNVTSCEYNVPDYWDIGGVYERLVEDCLDDAITPDADAVVSKLFEVYSSWIDDAIQNYNTDFFYQPRQYIALCYKEGIVIDE